MSYETGYSAILSWFVTLIALHLLWISGSLSQGNISSKTRGRHLSAHMAIIQLCNSEKNIHYTHCKMCRLRHLKLLREVIVAKYFVYRDKRNILQNGFLSSDKNPLKMCFCVPSAIASMWNISVERKFVITISLATRKHYILTNLKRKGKPTVRHPTAAETSPHSLPTSNRN